MVKISASPFRTVLNEAQNTNFQHYELLQMVFADCVKAGLDEDDGIMNWLNNQIRLTGENQKMIMAGQKFFTLVDRQNQNQYGVC